MSRLSFHMLIEHKLNSYETSYIIVHRSKKIELHVDNFKIIFNMHQSGKHDKFVLSHLLHSHSTNVKYVRIAMAKANPQM